ncbi:hypothetical protein ES703_14026 [subsurface metagenome]
MTEKELKIRVKFWYLKFERLSTEIDQLHTELERLKKITERVNSENTKLVIELKKLQEQQSEMKFDHIELGQ